MMPRAAYLAAAILPIVGLGGLWGWSDHLSRQGTEWDVEIQGYDPRDLLRGHYVEFTYDWPEPPSEESEGEGDFAFEPGPYLLCLYGSAPNLDHAERIEEAAFEGCVHPARADPESVYGYTSLERGRLYVGQDRAKEIEEALFDRNQRGIVRIRQRDDGTITPISIRFRPATEEELGEPDSEDVVTVIPAPPPIEPAPDD